VESTDSCEEVNESERHGGTLLLSTDNALGNTLLSSYPCRMESLPRYQELIEPMLEFLRSDATEHSNFEINAAVASRLNIPEHLLKEIHSGNRTEFEYRMAWARTKAKSEGRIFSPKRETWTLNN
jgi:hypothetical protein